MTAQWWWGMLAGGWCATMGWALYAWWHARRIEALFRRWEEEDRREQETLRARLFGPDP